MTSVPNPIVVNSAGVDLSQRFVASSTVVASPTDATETVIASVTIPSALTATFGVLLSGWATLTIGTTGDGFELIIRKTNISGSAIVSTDVLSAAAGEIHCNTVSGIDTSPTLPGQVYVLTLTVDAATAASTVAAVDLRAFVV